MMSEKQQYRLEENNQTNELILWEDAKILNVFKSSYDNRKHLNIIVDLLNEQQSIIEQLQDLCGESDYENAKLKLKNKELQDKIDWLCEKYDYPNNKGVKNDII